MEASTSRRPFSGGSARGILSSRRGSLIVAAGVALLAAILIFLFVDNRNGGGLVGGGATRVLVANALIPKGSSGDVIAARGIGKPTTLDDGDVKGGAISDPADLKGKIATQDIYPGQQLTESSFKAGNGSITGKLAGDQRAVAVPVDQAHGMIGTVKTGDRVDVFVAVGNSGNANEPAVRALLQNVMVLQAPDADKKDSANIVLRADSDQAAKLAFAADNGKIWVALRPPVGAASTKGSTVTLDSLLAGTTAVPGGSD